MYVTKIDYDKVEKLRAELQKLRPDDEIQDMEQINVQEHELLYIATAGHGYFPILKTDPNYEIARKICEFGYKGKLAVYLEEDCEIAEYLRKI